MQGPVSTVAVAIRRGLLSVVYFVGLGPIALARWLLGAVRRRRDEPQWRRRRRSERTIKALRRQL